MKKLLFVVVLLFSGAMTAQTLNFGAKAGVNFATLSGDDVDDADSRTGFHLGLIGEIMLTDRFAVQPEVLYSAQGAEGDGATWKLDYVAVPVMAKYFVTNGLSLEAGPQFSFNTTSEVEGEGETVDIDAESMDIGLGLGLGYQFMQSIFVQARYNMGFSDVVEDLDAKNSVFQLSLGYKF
ncbi:porin family protein [Salinimicrobium sp. CAU 1759]